MRELQLDGLVGMTHNYAGLSVGNVASMGHRGQVSHPRAAALQGIEKMVFVASLGVPQAVMPPHCRPELDVLASLGFDGDDETILAKASAADPALLAQASSASAMWTANAATVTPSCDAFDGRVHLTPANLMSKFHRAIEPSQTSRLLHTIFPDDAIFAHHPPLPKCDQFADEGAANHTRLATEDASVHLFVYGRVARDADAAAPRRFPARHTLEASQAIARTHGIEDPVFVQQQPDAIDAGVFHNDVISVGAGSLLLLHERAFIDTPGVLSTMQARLGDAFTPLIVTDDMLSIEETVATYLFNSQLLATEEGWVLIAPQEAGANPASKAVLDAWVNGNAPITRVHFLNLRESMQNGGGPACLRLRVPLHTHELEAIHPGVRLDDTLAATLRDWVGRWYPEELHEDELADPVLARSVRDALHELTELLGIGPVYPFQASSSNKYA
jgi:succinylarginine dihydrolase